jgi:hypothetical protein
MFEPMSTEQRDEHRDNAQTDMNYAGSLTVEAEFPTEPMTPIDERQLTATVAVVHVLGSIAESLAVLTDIMREQYGDHS